MLAQKLPVLLSPIEVGRLLSHFNGVYWLIACLQYGPGLRLIESVDYVSWTSTLITVLLAGGKGRAFTLADELGNPLKRIFNR